MSMTPNKKHVAGVVIFRRNSKGEIEYLMLQPPHSKKEISPPKGRFEDVYENDDNQVLAKAIAHTREKTRLVSGLHYDILKNESSPLASQNIYCRFEQRKKTNPNHFKSVTYFLGELKLVPEPNDSLLWCYQERAKEKYAERVPDHKPFFDMIDMFHTTYITKNNYFR